MPERTINLDTRRTKPTKLVEDAGGDCLTYFHSPIVSFFFLTLSGRLHDIDLKYCHKGPLNPKQPTTNLPFSFKKKKSKECYVVPAFRTNVRGKCMLEVYARSDDCM